MFIGNILVLQAAISTSKDLVGSGSLRTVAEVKVCLSSEVPVSEVLIDE